MKIFKEIISITTPFVSFGLGMGIGKIITGDYKAAAWILLVVSIFYLIGYFVERTSD